MSTKFRFAPPSTRSVILYLAGFSCLFLTAAMNMHAGVSQAATEHGRDLLGAAAIIIDIVGIVIFGSIAGNLLAAGKRAIGLLVLLVAVGAAAYSITSIISFVAGEWNSVAASRRAAIEVGKARELASLQAAKERREAQERLAKSGQDMMAATVKDASRKEKRVLAEKFAKGTAEMIDALGKDSSQPKPEPGPTLQMLPDAGAEMFSWLAGVPERTYQVTRMAGMACLLILFKIIAFPLAGYYWNTRSMKRDAVTVDGIAIEPVRLAAPVVSPQLDITPIEPVQLEASKPPLQIAKTEPAPVVKATLPEAPQFSPEWRALLHELKFFPDSKKGKLREGLKRDVLGYHCLAWINASGRFGDLTVEQAEQLITDFHSASHRELINGVNVLKGELRQAADKVNKKAILVSDNKGPGRPTKWTINPVSINRLRDVLTKRGILGATSTKPVKEATAEAVVDPTSRPAVAAVVAPTEAGGESRVVPFSGGAARPASLPRRPVQGLAELQRFRPNLEAMRVLERTQKLAWQQRAHASDRKQLNRMSRARAA
jgi:hypothetical protein